MRRKGARWTAGSAAASVEYLATYSGNPITVNNDVADAEQISAASLGAQFLTGEWHMDFTPAFASSETTNRYFWAMDSSNYLLKLNSADQVRFRHNGVNDTWFAITWSASDSLRFHFDPTNTQAGFSVNGGSFDYVTIADVDLPGSTDLFVGQSWLSLLPFSGDIYQPIAGAPP